MPRSRFYSYKSEKSTDFYFGLDMLFETVKTQNNRTIILFYKSFYPGIT